MRDNPKGIRYIDAVRVVTHYFGEPRRSGGSHTIFKTPWPGDPRVNLQSGKNGKAKVYQIKQLLSAIDQLQNAE
ncbi:toxin HicA [Marinobacterium aestuariivivens]|uniref:Toxin HicA n=1 Tax=Marinobacterium aestuariivivens TaxID=1698799 RepID=A0ABW2A9G3_9GAMM